MSNEAIIGFFPKIINKQVVRNADDFIINIINTHKKCVWVSKKRGRNGVCYKKIL